MGGLEIERKFLVADDSYKSLATSSSHIKQGYICNERGRTVRVRLRDERAYLTIKGPSHDDGLSRYEFEQEISLADAEQLFHLCVSGVIDKRRYLVPVGRHTFEIDEFYGANAGLVVAEVELSTTKESFERPSFLAEEVTGDRRYYNSMLSMKPFSLWD